MTYLFDNFKNALTETEEWLKKELSNVRTGQASPSILDSITIESYGVRTPLNQVGSIGLEGPRALRISVWDKGQIKAIEKAIRDRDLGLSISTDDAGVRVFFPEVTTEQKEKFVKLAKDKLEEARIAVRNDRNTAVSDIQKLEKSDDISEDESFRNKEQVQKLVDTTNENLNDIFDRKEEEILST